MEEKKIAEIVRKILTVIAEREAADKAPRGIPVGISNRHIHLSAAHMETLFGCGSMLTHQKDLKQEGEFAAAETVTLVGPKGVIRGVRVLGPIRNHTQVEISRTDGFSLGIVPPVRDSGHIEGSAGIVIVGACGAVTLKEGVICAARHIHMHDDDAKYFQVADGDRVTVETHGDRGALFKNVLVRVNPKFRLEMHVDTDEANALGLKNGDKVTLFRHEGVQGGYR